MNDLETDTRLESNGAEGHFRARLGPAWEAAAGRPAGGLLAALALRAAGQVSGLPRPVSLGVQFVQPAHLGEIDLIVSPLRTSGRTAALRVSILQSEAPILEGWVWTAADDLPGYAVEFAPIPEHPGPEGLPSVTEAAESAGRPMAACWSHTEFRSRWREPGEAGAPREPLARSWHRFRSEANHADAHVDAARVVFLAEALAMTPLLYLQGACITGLPWLASCLDLTVQFHRDTRAADWLMYEGRVPAASAGFVHSHAGLWSRDGSLVASVGANLACRRNLAAIPGAA